MLYSSAGLLALIIHIIINFDILERNPKKERIPIQHTYRAFLCSLMFFFVTDILWGIFDARHLVTLAYYDTYLYFFSMTASVILWTRYAVRYLKEQTVFGKTIVTVSWGLFAFVMIMLALNFVRPVMFYYDASGRYIPGIARDITLIVQIAMFAVIAVHVFIVASNAHGTMKTRCRAIGLFSIAMALFVGLQFCFPLLPMYAIGCMLGCCLLHTFVQENEKEEYRESLEYELQQNIEKGNYYDLLTGLPGMTYFFGIAEEKRRDFIAQGITPAFVFIDLSGMKLYNLKHGFAEGDKLLQNLSKVIVMEFGEDSCSRFAQDHFAVIAKEFGLKERLERMFKVWETSGFEETLPIRAGIYVDNMDKVDVPTACDRAKTACDTIRDRYVSSLYYFDRELLIAAEKKHYVITHIDQALKEKWVKIYYQPIIRVSNGSVCSEEALARWDDPERGFMTPGDFIPALEDGRLIYKLDLYVLDRVLEKLKCLKDAGKDMVPQSINLSRIDFEVCDIAGEISRRVDDMGIPHEYIVIEITESTIGSNFEFIKEQIERFRSMGFSVWMDDFGSGYSTLDMLSKIKVDLIKFDMRFIQQFESSETNKIVINELIKLAMALGIDTLCEGVETKQQADFLRYSGCTRLQGFYYAVPLPVEQLFEIYADDKEMGLENLDESDYYERIGKINLYDLSVITREDSGSFRNYFNTIPMAVIEVKGNRARFTRSNQAYRAFMQGLFGVDLLELGDKYGETPAGPGQPFVDMLKKCDEGDGRAVFDEVMPDGTAVHSYMRRIAENPKTGTMAVAVAVLAISPGAATS